MILEAKIQYYALIITVLMIPRAFIFTFTTINNKMYLIPIHVFIKYTLGDRFKIY